MMLVGYKNYYNFIELELYYIKIKDKHETENNNFRWRNRWMD